MREACRRSREEQRARQPDSDDSDDDAPPHTLEPPHEAQLPQEAEPTSTEDSQAMQGKVRCMRCEGWVDEAAYDKSTSLCTDSKACAARVGGRGRGQRKNAKKQKVR